MLKKGRHQFSHTNVHPSSSNASLMTSRAFSCFLSILQKRVLMVSCREAICADAAAPFSKERNSVWLPELSDTFSFLPTAQLQAACALHIAPRIDKVWYVLGDLARLKDLGHFRSCFSLRCEEWSFGPSDPIEEKWCEGASERAAGPNESNLSECDATGRKERERGARTNGRGLTCERFALLSSSFRLPLAVFFVAFPQGLESKQQKYVWRV